jgi:hypothetical protein
VGTSAANPEAGASRSVTIRVLYYILYREKRRERLERKAGSYLPTRIGSV